MMKKISSSLLPCQSDFPDRLYQILSKTDRCSSYLPSKCQMWGIGSLHWINSSTRPQPSLSNSLKRVPPPTRTLVGACSRDSTLRSRRSIVRLRRWRMRRRGHRGRARARVRRCSRMIAMRRIMGGHRTSYFIALVTQRAGLAGAHNFKSSKTCLQIRSHTRDTKCRY